MKEKKKMSKMIMFGIVGVFAMVLVSAAVYLYVGSASIDITVEEGLTMTSVPVGFYDLMYGETSTETLEITNAADVALGVQLSYVEQSNNYVLGADEILYDGENGYLNADFEAGRDAITIVFETPVALSALEDISFDQYVVEGYPVSVNILLDVDGDNAFESKKDLITGYLTDGADDVLKIEWAGNGATAGFLDAYMESEDYNRWVNVFPNGAMSGDTVAWLYSVSPGDNPVTEDNEMISGTLTEWKNAGFSRGTECYQISDIWTQNICEDALIDGTTMVYGIEIESLGWIAESGSKIRNIEVGTENYGADGVKYTVSNLGGVIEIPVGTESTDIEVDFTVSGTSPVGEFTGVINVERVALPE